MQKVERLVNLIALLLNTRYPLTVEQIRNTVPGYQQEDYSSFKRMFERDKEELRSLGIPIEREFTDVWEVEEGYRIRQDRYYLPELDLTPEEMAALWISSRIVVEDEGKGSQGLMKLALASDTGADPTSPQWLRARLHLDAPSLPQVLEAVAGRRRLRFSYRNAGQARAVERTVDPYALIHEQGAWYIVGYDHLRDAIRHFKLQRITSAVKPVKRGSGPDFEVPEGFSPEGRSVTEPWVGEEGVKVDVAFSPRLAWWAEQSLGLEPTGTWKDWTVFSQSVVDEEGFVTWVIGFGRDAVVRSPASVRQAVIKRLRAVARTPRPKGRAPSKAKAKAKTAKRPAPKKKAER